MSYSAAHRFYSNRSANKQQSAPVSEDAAQHILAQKVEAIVREASEPRCYRSWDHEDVARKAFADVELASGRYRLDDQTIVIRNSFGSYAVIYANRDRTILTLYVFNSGTEDYDGEDQGWYRAQFNTSSIGKDLRARLEPLPRLSAVQMIEGTV